MKITKTTHILFISLIIVIIFSNSLKNKFAWDDKSLILNNPYIKDPAYITEVFSSQLYEGNMMHSNFYRPIQLLSFMIDYRLWKLNPFGYHLTSLLLHIVNSALVYLIIFAISSSPYMSFITASLFGIAPAISGITFYTSARSDLLMASFIFLSILFFIKYKEKKKTSLYIISIISFALSLLCKEMAVMLPLLLLLVGNGLKPFPTLRKVLTPYIAILAIYIGLRVTIFNFTKGLNPIVDLSFPATLPLWARLLTDFKVIFLYLKILALPIGLHMEWFIEPVKNISRPEIYLYIIGFIIMILVIIKISSRNKLILFGSLWFLLALLPVLNIYPISVLFGEGWLYIPSIGFFIALSAVFQDIIKPSLGKSFSGILIALFLVYYAIFTIFYGIAWKDSINLFNNVLRYEKNSPFIYLTYNNLGMAYYDKGDLEKAIEYCKKSISLNSRHCDAYNNLGIVYAAVGKNIKAIRCFKEAIRLKKDDVSGYYANMGQLYAIIGVKNRAMDVLNAAIRMNPNSYKAHCNLGYVYADKGDMAKAEEFFKKASSLRKEDYEPHYCLGLTYIKNKNYKKALSEFTKALKLGLHGSEIYNKVGFAYIKNDRFKDAEAAFIYSLTLNKDQCEPHNNLGNLYSLFGRFDLARHEYREALKIEPCNKGIVDNIVKTKNEWKEALIKKRK